MFTQISSFTKFFVHLAQVQYKVYPGFLTNEITNICALHNLDQGVRKEAYDLITHELKMTKKDKLIPYAAEDDH